MRCSHLNSWPAPVSCSYQASTVASIHSARVVSSSIFSKSANDLHLIVIAARLKTASSSCTKPLDPYLWSTLWLELYTSRRVRTLPSPRQNGAPTKHPALKGCFCKARSCACVTSCNSMLYDFRSQRTLIHRVYLRLGGVGGVGSACARYREFNSGFEY